MWLFDCDATECHVKAASHFPLARGSDQPNHRNNLQKSFSPWTNPNTNFYFSQGSVKMQKLQQFNQGKHNIMNYSLGEKVVSYYKSVREFYGNRNGNHRIQLLFSELREG